MSRLIGVFTLIMAALLLYRFWPRIFAALKRFDENNIARIRQENVDRTDQLAHFRHTVNVSEEQVDDIIEIEELDPRTATSVTRYVFEGERFATRREAEKARAQKIGDIARGFYRDLPTALRARKSDDRLN